MTLHQLSPISCRKYGGEAMGDAPKLLRSGALRSPVPPRPLTRRELAQCTQHHGNTGDHFFVRDAG